MHIKNNRQPTQKKGPACLTDKRDPHISIKPLQIYFFNEAS